jgi:hypothetical protein
MKIEAAKRLVQSANATIPVSQAGAFFPQFKATLTNLKDGETTKIKVGSDTHTVTRKGNMLHLSK